MTVKHEEGSWWDGAVEGSGDAGASWAEEASGRADDSAGGGSPHRLSDGELLARFDI